MKIKQKRGQKVAGRVRESETQMGVECASETRGEVPVRRLDI